MKKCHDLFITINMSVYDPNFKAFIGENTDPSSAPGDTIIYFEYAIKKSVF